jgi:hypothetical protein
MIIGTGLDEIIGLAHSVIARTATQSEAVERSSGQDCFVAWGSGYYTL